MYFATWICIVICIFLSSYGAKSLTEPDGFCFTWAGARATYGVTRGKVFINVTITTFFFSDYSHQSFFLKSGCLCVYVCVYVTIRKFDLLRI